MEYEVYKAILQMKNHLDQTGSLWSLIKKLEDLERWLGGNGWYLPQGKASYHFFILVMEQSLSCPKIKCDFDWTVSLHMLASR
jgi:hypothetical protein